MKKAKINDRDGRHDAMVLKRIKKLEKAKGRVVFNPRRGSNPGS